MNIPYWLNVILIMEFLGHAFELEKCTCPDVCGEENKELLGQGTWRLLHEMVENVERTKENEDRFKNLILSLQYLYPCGECRKHIEELNLVRMEIEMTPEFMCNFHNKVNKQLGKEIFTCTSFPKAPTAERMPGIVVDG